MKKIIFSFLTFFISILFIIFVDFVISNTYLKTAQNTCDYFQEYYYELKKNCIGKKRFKKGFPTVNIFTDENGLRVKKNHKRNSDKKNILIFGDSFTYGWGLNYEDTYVAKIEKELKNFNVYNFAVGSYSPAVHLFKLNSAIQKSIIPHKIIVFLDFTDVLDESTRWNYELGNDFPQLTYNHLEFIKKKSGLSYKQKNFKLLTSMSYFINFHSRILRSKIDSYLSKNQIDNEVGISHSIQANFTYTSIVDLDPRFWKENQFAKGINRIKNNIKLMQDIALKYDSEFYIVIYPWAETLVYGQKEFNWSEYSKTLCTIGKCKLIDSFDHFYKYKDENINWKNQLYFISDQHFNKLGAELLSNVVLKNINVE